MLKRSRESSFDLEALEDRRLLSASAPLFVVAASFTSIPTISASLGDKTLTSIEFSQAPMAVQTGLDSLATTDNLKAPTATQTVTLGNSDGIETYAITLRGTGARTTLTVDENGNAVAAPTKSRTTFGTLGGMGTNSNTVASNEITAIATALNLTAPASTTVVHIATTSAGVTTYSVNLLGAPSVGIGIVLGGGTTTVTVDSNGNPIAPAKVPFSVVPAAIQNGLNASAPGGATLPSDSTKNVRIATTDGVTTYSVTFRSTGIKTIVSVNSSGVLTNTPFTGTIAFDEAPAAAQTELQTLANDYGVAGTISTTQAVSVYTESDGNAIYTAELKFAQTFHGTLTLQSQITISVDENGDPTILPTGAPVPSVNGSFFEFGAGIGSNAQILRI